MKNKILRFLELWQYRISLGLIDAVVVWLVVAAAVFLAGGIYSAKLAKVCVVLTGRGVKYA